MSSRIHHTFIAQTNNGEIEFDFCDGKITVNQTHMEPSYISFILEKEDWEKLKNAVETTIYKKSRE